MTIEVKVSKREDENPFEKVINTIHAETVNVPKFLQAYPILARFPTRSVSMVEQDYVRPVICELVSKERALERQNLKSWFVSFAAGTINGNPVDKHLLDALFNATLLAMAHKEPTTFRVDPNEENFHLLEIGKVHLLITSDRVNGEIQKVTIIKRF